MRAGEASLSGGTPTAAVRSLRRGRARATASEELERPRLQVERAARGRADTCVYGGGTRKCAAGARCDSGRQCKCNRVGQPGKPDGAEERVMETATATVLGCCAGA